MNVMQKRPIATLDALDVQTFIDMLEPASYRKLSGWSKLTQDFTPSGEFYAIVQAMIMAESNDEGILTGSYAEKDIIKRFLSAVIPTVVGLPTLFDEVLTLWELDRYIREMRGKIINRHASAQDTAKLAWASIHTRRAWSNYANFYARVFKQVARDLLTQLNAISPYIRERMTYAQVTTFNEVHKMLRLILE